MLVVARDLGRFPSELKEKGYGAYRVEFKAPGWLGRWLRFEGVVEDCRSRIQYVEFVQMMGLYLAEKEEAEEAKRNAERGIDA